MTRAARIYLDTNVFRTAYETKGRPSEDAWWLFCQVEQGAGTAFTSELTLSKLLAGPLIRKENDLVDVYSALISDGTGLTVVPVDRSILIGAAKIRAETRSLRLPDAIHLASASLMSCAHVLSDDRRLPPIEGLRPLRLGTDEIWQFRQLLQ